MVYEFFDSQSEESEIKSCVKPSQGLADKLHKPIIRMFQKPKVYKIFLILLVYSY